MKTAQLIHFFLLATTAWAMDYLFFFVKIGNDYVPLTGVEHAGTTIFRVYEVRHPVPPAFFMQDNLALTNVHGRLQSIGKYNGQMAYGGNAKPMPITMDSNSKILIPKLFICRDRTEKNWDKGLIMLVDRSSKLLMCIPANIYLLSAEYEHQKSPHT